MSDLGTAEIHGQPTETEVCFDDDVSGVQE